MPLQLIRFRLPLLILPTKMHNFCVLKFISMWLPIFLFSPPLVSPLLHFKLFCHLKIMSFWTILQCRSFILKTALSLRLCLEKNDLHFPPVKIILHYYFLLSVLGHLLSMLSKFPLIHQFSFSETSPSCGALSNAFCRFMYTSRIYYYKKVNQNSQNAFNKVFLSS